MPVSFLILCTLLLCLAFVEARLNFASNSDVGNDRNVKPKDATCSETPSAKTKVDFPESLAGRSIASSFDMYTGYINVTDTPDYLFYWFFAAQNGDENAPLVIWTNGGPGCSSMEGASTENTPLTLFDIKESCSSDQCDYSGQLSTNPYGWNARANVLYIDQPRYVGFSFGCICRFFYFSSRNQFSKSRRLPWSAPGGVQSMHWNKQDLSLYVLASMVVVDIYSHFHFFPLSILMLFLSPRHLIYVLVP